MESCYYMRIFLLFAFTFAFINLSFSQSGNGHTQTTTLSYNPTGFSASNMLQDAGTTTAAKSTINNNAAANAYANFEYDTSGKRVYVVYTTDNTTPNKSNGTQVEGSFNNYNDIFASLEILISLKSTGTVIVKHANPSGVSINKSPIKSFQDSLSCDPVSAFGGIVACNYLINKKIAKEISKTFFDRQVEFNTKFLASVVGPENVVSGAINVSNKRKKSVSYSVHANPQKLKEKLATMTHYTRRTYPMGYKVWRISSPTLMNPYFA